MHLYSSWLMMILYRLGSCSLWYVTTHTHTHTLSRIFSFEQCCHKNTYYNYEILINTNKTCSFLFSYFILSVNASQRTVLGRATSPNQAFIQNAFLDFKPCIRTQSTKPNKVSSSRCSKTTKPWNHWNYKKPKFSIGSWSQILHNTWISCPQVSFSCKTHLENKISKHYI